MNQPDEAILSASTFSTGKNLRCRTVTVFTAYVAACLACGAYAADQSPAANTHKKEEKIKMDEPMQTGMMKQGMMKGDVKSAAEKKAREMQPMMEQEEKSMPQDKARQ